MPNNFDPTANRHPASRDAAAEGSPRARPAATGSPTVRGADPPEETRAADILTTRVEAAEVHRLTPVVRSTSTDHARPRAALAHDAVENLVRPVVSSAVDARVSGATPATPPEVGRHDERPQAAQPGAHAVVPDFSAAYALLQAQAMQRNFDYLRAAYHPVHLVDASRAAVEPPYHAAGRGHGLPSPLPAWSAIATTLSLDATTAAGLQCSITLSTLTELLEPVAVRFSTAADGLHVFEYAALRTFWRLKGAYVNPINRQPLAPRELLRVVLSKPG